MVWRKDHILVPGLYCHEITKVKWKSEALAGNQRFFLKEKCKKKKKNYSSCLFPRTKTLVITEAKNFLTITVQVVKKSCSANTFNPASMGQVHSINQDTCIPPRVVITYGLCYVPLPFHFSSDPEPRTFGAFDPTSLFCSCPKNLGFGSFFSCVISVLWIFLTQSLYWIFPYWLCKVGYYTSIFLQDPKFCPR